MELMNLRSLKQLYPNDDEQILRSLLSIPSSIEEVKLNLLKDFFIQLSSEHDKLTPDYLTKITSVFDKGLDNPNMSLTLTSVDKTHILEKLVWDLANGHRDRLNNRRYTFCLDTQRHHLPKHLNLFCHPSIFFALCIRKIISHDVRSLYMEPTEYSVLRSSILINLLFHVQEKLHIINDKNKDDLWKIFCIEVTRV